MKKYGQLITKSLLLLGFVPIALADHWVTDPIGDCQVWSYGDAADKEVVSWSGSCEEGKASGRGVLVVSDPKGLLAVYDGEMHAGHGNGFGSLRFRTTSQEAMTPIWDSSKAACHKGEGSLSLVKAGVWRARFLEALRLVQAPYTYAKKALKRMQ